MDVRTLLDAPPETLVPVGWVREHILPEPDPVLVQYRLALQVASSYWAGVILGELPPPLARAGRIPHGERNDHREARRQMSKAWREKFGTKGVSRVTLFTRPGESPYIYIEWWRDGKRIARRLECDGVPVSDVSVARSVARETVEKLEDKVKEEFWMKMASKPDLIPDSVKEMLGAPATSRRSEFARGGGPGTEAAARVTNSGTVEDMFDRWMAVQEADMKAKTISVKQWKEALGCTTILSSLKPADLDDAVKKTTEKHKWAEKTRFNKIRHLRMALTYARNRMLLECPDPEELDCPKPNHPDTEALTYSDQDYDQLLSTALRIANSELPLGPETGSDGSEILTPSQALLVAGALSVCGTFGRRINQTRTMTTSGVKRVTLLKEIPGFEFQFPRATEKCARFQDAKYTVATLNATQHPLQYQAVERLLATPGVQTSGLLFPSVPYGKSIMDCLSPTFVGQDTLREYLRKLERVSGVEHVEGRAYHGLKRLAATRCKTMKELKTLSLTSNTALKTLEGYHKRLGTFSNVATRLAQEEALKKSLEEEAGETA